jgi:hypothetical protein
MTPQLLMLCPSRGRPAKAAELLSAWQATSTGAARLLLAVDDDDPEIGGYHDVLADLERVGWGAYGSAGPAEPCWTIGPRERLGPTLNRLAIAAGVGGGYQAVGFLGDDHRPRSYGWDTRLLEALDRVGGGVAYGNDLLQGENLPTAVAISSQIIHTLGYMVPPGLTHLYLDNTWRLWGEQTGRLCYLHDVIIEHVHPIAGKALWDERYAEVNAPEMYQADEKIFRRYLATEWPADLAKLRRLLSASSTGSPTQGPAS